MKHRFVRLVPVLRRCDYARPTESGRNPVVTSTPLERKAAENYRSPNRFVRTKVAGKVRTDFASMAPNRGPSRKPTGQRTAIAECNH